MNMFKSLREEQINSLVKTENKQLAGIMKTIHSMTAELNKETESPRDPRL